MSRTFQRLGPLFLLLALLLPSIPVAEALTPTPRPSATPLPLSRFAGEGEGGRGVGVRAPLDVVINEIAWMGTAYDANDEWMELYNNTDAPIDLTGWTLQAADGTPNITLAGTIPAHGYFLLERTDDTTIPDIPADQIYTGALGNTGEVLTLRDAGSNIIDTANGDGGGWPAGDNTTKRTMERIDPLSPDSDANWASNDGVIRNGHDYGGNPLNGTPKLRNSVSAPAADLFIRKTGPAQAPADSDIVYTLTFGNWGNLTAASTLLTDTLPAGVTFVSQVSPYPYSQPLPGVVVWEIGAVPFTLTTFPITITAHIALTASGTLVNEAEVATPVAEVTTANNAAQAATVVQPIAADLQAGKTGPAAAAPGDPLTYTLVISSVGPVAAAAVRVTDTLPAGASFVGQASPYPYTRPTPRTVVWTVGDLSPGNRAEITLYAAVQFTATGVLTNVVSASTSSPEANLLDNTAFWRTAVRLPTEGHVVINEVAWAGHAGYTSDEWIELYNLSDVDVDLAGWTLRSNDGTPSITLTGVITAGGYYLLERDDDNTVSDIPADQIYTGALVNTGEALTLRDAGGNVVDTANGDGGPWPAGSASPNYQSMERIRADRPDSDANWASNDMVTRNGHDAGGNPINGTPKQRNSVSPLPVADLAAAKTAPAAAYPGDPITYTLAVSNIGLLPAAGVRITDTLPAGVAFVSQSSPYTFTQVSSDTLLWETGTLPAGSAVLIALYGVVRPTATGTLPNQVYASTVSGEITLTNNLAWAYTLVQTETPDLAVAKSGPPTTYAGEPITYTLTVENVGLAAAPAVRVTDTLPSGVAFLSQDSPYTFTQPAPQVLVWELGALDPGAPTQFTVYGQVETTAAGTLTNRLIATTTAAEPNLSNNSAAWDTRVLLPSTGRVVINEVAWGGTAASTSDEWMELYNASPYAIDLTGWVLSDGGDISITLAGILPSGGYFLLERGDDNTVSDIPADLIYTGGLNNTGEVLTLRDRTGAVVDTANGNGGSWPAGSGSPNYQSMERIDPLAPDTDANWVANDMVHRNGLDASGNPINGTPKRLNSPRQRPDLAVQKTGPLTVTVGMPITYSLVIQNLGAIPAPDVRVTDTLPSGVDFRAQESDFPFAFSQAAPGVLVWTAASLPTATSAAITLSGQVRADALPQLHNSLAAATSAAETDYGNNTASWDTLVQGARRRIYLPLIFANYYRRVEIEAVLYDGYQSGDLDEAVRLLNIGTVDVDLSGWELCKDTTGGLNCKALPAVVLPAGAGIWVTRNAAAFERSFGFPADYQLASWLANGLANTGDEVFLRENGRIVDGIVFGDSPYSGPGWSGPAVYPYRGSGNFSSEGQILRRIWDEATGKPIRDTDTAADWIQYAGDNERGRRVLYPGWDMDRFFWPYSETVAASLTVGIAPDNAVEVVLTAIGLAQYTIEGEFYEFEHWGIAQALKAKAAAGVTVTLLLEGEPAGGMTDQELWLCKELHEAGGQCYFMFNDTTTTPTMPIYDRYTNLHSKFMLIDREWALVSSQNPTGGGMPDDDKSDGTWGSRGVLLLTDAPGLVARLAAIFDADLDPAHHNDLALLGTHGYDPPIYFVPITSTGGTTSTVNFPLPLRLYDTFGFEVLSAPESSLRQSDSLLGLLKQAGPGDEIAVEQMYEYPAWGQMPDTSPAPNLRLAAYIAAARRGARVRILLNSGTFSASYLDISKNAETLAYINNLAYCEGLDLQARIGNPTAYGIHNKMVLARIAGQGYAHIGSINGSETSSKVNREVAVNVRSDAVYAYLAGMFDWDWDQSGHLLVSEVLYNPDGEDDGKEWVEIFNPTEEPIDLTGWTLGDALNLNEYGSGRYYFPAGTVIPPHSLLTVAQLAQMAGFRPDFEFVTDPALDDPSVPNMVKVANWDGFGFALGNSGDRVLLLDPSGAAVDVIIYGNATYPGVTPHPGVAAGHSLERRPPERDTDTCSADLADNPLPTPGAFPEGYHKCD